MVKRNKNEEPSPINVCAKVCETHTDILAIDLYKALQPTLAKDWLLWEGYNLPAKHLLQLCQIWKQDKEILRIVHEENTNGMIIHSSRRPDGSFATRTRLELTCQDDNIPGTLERWQAVFIPLNFGIAPIEKKRIDPWIMRACSRDQARPSFCQSWGEFGTDGFRVHIDNRIEPVTPEGQDQTLREMVNTLKKEFLKGENIMTVNTKALSKALKGLRNIAKKGAGYVTLKFSDTLELSAKAEDVGTASNVLTYDDGYSYDGEPMILAISPVYLIDALDGLGSVATLRMKDKVNPVFLTDKIREALIMPMHPEEN